MITYNIVSLTVMLTIVVVQRGYLERYDVCVFVQNCLGNGGVNDCVFLNR